MRIIQDNQGWRIEPDTSEEEAHLKYLFEALEKAYAGACVEDGSEEQSSVQNMPITTPPRFICP